MIDPKILDSCPVVGCQSYMLYCNHREHEKICHPNLAVIRLQGDKSRMVIKKTVERFGLVLKCPNCPDLSYTSTSGIQKHFDNKHKKAKALDFDDEVLSTSQASISQPTEYVRKGPETLVQSHILRQVDCSFNTSYRLLICNTCEHAVEPSQFQNHVRLHGKSLGVRDFGTLLKNLAPVSMKMFQRGRPTVCDTVRGVKVNPRGYLCGIEGCYTARTTKESFRTHCKLRHRGQHALLKVERGHMQTVFGPGTCCTCVRPSIREEEIGKRAAAYMRNLPVPQLVPIDAEAEQTQSPFMRNTKWFTYYTSIGQGPRAITRTSYRKLAHPVQLSESEKSIRDNIHAYTDMLRPLIAGAHDLPLKWVNSKDVGSTHRPFTVPGTSTAREAYADFYYAMINFFVKNAPFSAKAGFEVNLSGKQNKLALELLKAFMGRRSYPSDEKHQEAIFNAIETFSWSLFAKTYDSKTFDRFSDPVMQFLLAYCLKSNGQVQPPANITPVLAKLQHIMRLTYFHHCYKESGDDSEKSMLDCVKVHKCHFTEGQDANTFESVQSLMHICTTLASSRDSLPMILWENDDSFRYEGVEIKMDDIIRMVDEELKEAERLLHEVVMKGLPVEKMLPPHSKIVDRLRNTMEGYNFLVEPENRFAEAQHNFVTSILEHEEYGPMFADLEPDGKLKYDPEAVKEWFEGVEEFLEKLFLIIHLTCGLPPRGTEACEMLIANLSDVSRNVCSIFEQTCLVGKYNKTSHNNAGRDKLIPRGLHSKVGKLFVEYMALVRPLEKTFAEQVAEPDIVKLFSTHLWVGLRGKWDSEKLSNILQESFYQYVNIPIGLAAWRHIATSIVRRKLTGQLGLQAEIKDWLVEMMANEQAGHSHELANQIYGGEVQGLGGAMHERELKRYLLVSHLWHVVMGLEPGGSLPLSHVLRDAISPGKEISTTQTAEDAELIPKICEAIKQALEEYTIQSEGVRERVSHSHIALVSEQTSIQTLLPSLEVLVKSAVEEQSAHIIKSTVDLLQAQTKQFAEAISSLKTSLSVSRTPSVSDSSQQATSERLSIFKRPNMMGPFTPVSLINSPASSHRSSSPTVADSTHSMGKVTHSNLGTAPAKVKPIYVPLPMVPVVATGFYSSQHPPPVVAGHLHSKDLVIDPELVKCLQQLFPGRKVGFRSIEQGYAVHFIVHDSKHHSMIIIPTSGGKTMLYVIPALRASSYGVYIAIIPNRSLLDILKRKVEAFGIRVEEWRGGDPSPGNRCPLVLISADAIAHATFPQFLATLKSSSKLLGIFIDEAHKLVSEVHYRNRLVSMHRIVGAGVPIHCLTATLCPGQEFKIANALRLKMEDFQIIRAKTDRPNLSYRVIKVKPTSSVHELEAVVQRVVSEFGKADKELKDSECGLIIVRSKDQVKMLVDRLGCSSFHGDMDPEVRIKEYTDWQFGKLEGRMGSGWMVSTTLIDTGMDVAKLRFTLYCENPYHFESYLQGAGRTAREGQDGEVTVIYSRFSAGKSNIGLDREFVGIKALEEYLDNTTECRRYQITKYTDGVGIACSAIENVNLCDTCNHGFFPSEVSIEIDPHVNTVPEALRVFRFETAHLESIVQSLQSLKYTLIPSKVCPFEFIITGEKVNDHTWKTCACMKTYPTSLASTRLTEGMEMFMSKIIWLANHTCYICWFPHGGKESRLHSDKDWLHRDPGAKEAGNNCRIFIAACLHSIFHNTGLRTKLESTFGLPKIPDDYEAFMSYIIQIQSPGLPMALVMIARCMQSNN